MDGIARRKTLRLQAVVVVEVAVADEENPQRGIDRARVTAGTGAAAARAAKPAETKAFRILGIRVAAFLLVRASSTNGGHLARP